MIQLHPALTFENQARPALQFYQSALGGDTDFNTYGDWANTGDATAEGVVNDSNRDYLVAGTLRTPSGHRITAADSLEPVTPGAGQAISLVGTPDDVEYLSGAYEKLQDGATDVTGFGPATWAPDEHFGTLTDKYGVHWEFGAFPKGRYLI